jgi:phospholipase C
MIFSRSIRSSIFMRQSCTDCVLYRLNGLYLLVLVLLLLSTIVLGLLPISSFAENPLTITPIHHLVIIFQENASFDHYFATYPKAMNGANGSKFIAYFNTPKVNGLNESLLNENPNSVNPFRLDPSQAVTCDMNHGYTAEQQAYNQGLVDSFVQYTGSNKDGCNPNLVMGYYDGNTVTALWNYAQHFAMSDNFFGTTYGPSLVGHLNLISGQTHGGRITNSISSEILTNLYNVLVNGTVIGNDDPLYDDCSLNNLKLSMEGKNIGDLLNAKGITWGWFSDGFEQSIRTHDRDWHCSFTGHFSQYKETITRQLDYSPVVEPFQYYNSTANPHHFTPTSLEMVGYTDRANHQYDLSYFWKAAESGNLPAVSFLKAATYQQGHPETSNPLDEQVFLVGTINRLQKLPQWSNMAIIITYDDSDGWYDHVMPPLVSPSSDPIYDKLFGSELCGNAPKEAYPGRCGYGPRIPLLIISPYSKINFVDHNVTDFTSILRFIEDNWILGRIGNQSLDVLAGPLNNMFNFTRGSDFTDKLFLDPSTGMVSSKLGR